MAGKAVGTKGKGDIVAAYAPAATVVAYHADLAAEASPKEFMEAFLAEMRLPSAFRHGAARHGAGQASALAGNPDLLDGRWHLFDLDRGYAGAEANLPEGLAADPADPFRRYRLGIPFAARLRRDGRLSARGKRLAPRALAGTVRLSTAGSVLGPADDPLALQATRLAAAGDAAHAAHLAALAALLAGTGCAVAEEEALSYARRDRSASDGWHARAAHLERALGRHGRLASLGKVATLGRALGIAAEAWKGRAEPGSGHAWDRLDDILETVSGRRPPQRALRVGWDAADPEGRACASRARGWVASATDRSGAEGPGLLAEAGRSEGASAAVVLDGLSLHIVAWDEDAPEPPPGTACDPLATEEVAALELEGLLAPPRRCPWLDGSALPGAFAPVEGMPGYPAAALVMAHASGATLGDLADALAQALPPPAPRGPGDAMDALFGPADAGDTPLAALAPEPPGPWIARLLGILDPGAGPGGTGLDLEREIRLLRDAETRGAGLLDLARLSMPPGR